MTYGRCERIASEKLNRIPSGAVMTIVTVIEEPADASRTTELDRSDFAVPMSEVNEPFAPFGSHRDWGIRDDIETAGDTLRNVDGHVAHGTGANDHFPPGPSWARINCTQIHVTSP
jgi:hypothetical protein